MFKMELYDNIFAKCGKTNGFYTICCKNPRVSYSLQNNAAWIVALICEIWFDYCLQVTFSSQCIVTLWIEWLRLHASLYCYSDKH